MKAIWKFPLDITQRGKPQTVMMPALYDLLSVGRDGDGNLSLWAEVATESPLRPRRITVYFTGEELPAFPGRFIGTVVLLNGLESHVYDRGEP